MQVKISDLPQHIQNDIEECVADNPSHFQRGFDAQATWPLQEALDAYLLWNGIIGYTSKILSIVDKAAGSPT